MGAEDVAEGKFQKANAQGFDYLETISSSSSTYFKLEEILPN